MIDQYLFNDWHAVATVREVKGAGPVAARIFDQDIVVWGADESIRAMDDQCPHRGTRLSLGEVRDNQLTCPYHGWRFNTDGQCTFKPAEPGVKPSCRTRVGSYPVKEAYGLVWTCLGEPERSIPDFVGLDEDYYLVITGPYEVATSAPRVVENFLDLAHLPFVHAGSLGEEPHTKIPNYDVAVTHRGIEVTNARVWQPNASSIHTEGQKIAYSYNVLRPYTVMLTKTPAEECQKPTDLIFLTVSPRSETQVRAWIIMATTYGSEETEQVVHDFQDNIFREDKPILESQRPKELPLDPTSEMHQRADKTSHHYRKWLRDLGITYGTIS